MRIPICILKCSCGQPIIVGIDAQRGVGYEQHGRNLDDVFELTDTEALAVSPDQMKATIQAWLDRIHNQADLPDVDTVMAEAERLIRGER